MSGPTPKNAPADMAMPSAVSVKTLLWFAGSLLGMITALGTLHAQFVIPRILREASTMMEEKIDRHERIPVHNGAIPRAELEARLQASQRQVETLLEQINQRLARIETRLDNDGK